MASAAGPRCRNQLKGSTLRIDVLNRYIQEGRLALSPFDAKGFSVTTTTTGAVFSLLDPNAAGMRLYANAVPVTDALTAEALLNLLALTGPGSPYGNLRLGIDPYRRFLWICTHVQNVPETDVLNAVSSFLSEAPKLIAAVVDTLANDAGTPAAPRQAAGSESSAVSSPRPASADIQAKRNELDAEELAELMRDNRILWG